MQVALFIDPLESIKQFVLWAVHQLVTHTLQRIFGKLVLELHVFARYSELNGGP